METPGTPAVRPCPKPHPKNGRSTTNVGNLGGGSRLRRSADGVTRHARSPRFCNPVLAVQPQKGGFNPDDLAPADGTDAFVEALLAAGGVEAMLARVGERLDTGADHVAVQMNHCGRRSAAWRGV